MRISLGSSRASILYRPLPPMMPIRGGIEGILYWEREVEIPIPSRCNARLDT